MPGSTPASLSAEARPIASSQGAAPASPVTAPPVAAAPVAPSVPRRRQRFSPWQEAWRRFRRHRLAVAGAVVLGLMVLAIAVGPLLWRVPINEIDFAAKLQGPSWSHPLGTDDLGQDVLARVLYGGRISVSVGLAAMVISIFAGVLIGAIAGMSSGRVDAVLMWLADLFLAIPPLPLLLLVIYLFRDSLKSVFGTELGVFILIVAVIAWPWQAPSS